MDLVVSLVKVRRGKATRSKMPDGLSGYINGMFKADEDGIKDYQGHATMRETQANIKDDITGPLNDCLRELFAAGRNAALEMAEEFQDFNDDLIEQTPWHEEGPTDPPLHAAEAWKNDFYPGSDGGFTLTIYNPKHYMAFLEDGWSPQAPAGWISAAWTLFVIKMEARLANG